MSLNCVVSKRAGGRIDMQEKKNQQTGPVGSSPTVITKFVMKVAQPEHHLNRLVNYHMQKVF